MLACCYKNDPINLIRKLRFKIQSVKHESNVKQCGGMLMRNNLMMEMHRKKFVCTHVTFGLTKAQKQGGNKQELTLLCPRCL